MKVTFWGTRGSIPTPGERTKKYGGNTSCVTVEAGNNLIILDAGSGIRELGVTLKERSNGKALEGHIFLSHTHWDHIQGFPFFVPFLEKGNSFHVYGNVGASKTIKSVLKKQMEDDFFPIGLYDLKASLDFTDLKDAPIVLKNDTKISFVSLNHPGMSMGFKVEHNGKSVVYATDYEPYTVTLDNHKMMDYAYKEFIKTLDRKFEEFIQNVDVLICDGQYTQSEYETKIGWGHACVEHMIKTAVKSSVKKLMIFHHDPMHSDEFIDKMIEGEIQKLTKSSKKMILEAAREGAEIIV